MATRYPEGIDNVTPWRVTEFLRRQPVMVHIARNGAWSADLADGGFITPYEKLDYHTGCRKFLEGSRDAGIPFTFHGKYVL